MTPAADIVASRMVAGWLLAKRAWLSDYRSSRWNAAWPLLQPIAYTGFLVAMRPLLGHADVAVAEYGIFVFLGFSLWMSWIETLRAQLGALRQHRSLVLRGDIGGGTIALATLITGGLQLGPRLLLGVALAGCVGGVVTIASVAMLALGGAFVLLNAAAIGAFLQPWATLMPGVDRAVQSVTLALLVSGGVFLAVPTGAGPWLDWVFVLNPFGALLDAARAPMLGHVPHAPMQAIGWALFTLLLGFTARRLGPRLLPIVVERLGN